MIRIVCLALVAPLILVSSVSAQTRSAAPASAPPPIPWANKFFLPDIEKDPSQAPPLVVSHNFGTVPRGTLSVHKFTITNIYDVPMQVVDIRRSSGNVQAYPPERVLLPNEKGEFIITMDTAKFTGATAETVYVTFGPQFLSTAVLRVTANSRADVMLSPGAVNFGVVGQGAKPEQTISLEYSGRQKDWKVTEVVASTGPLDVKVQEAGRGKFYVTATLKDGAPTGPISDVISLKTNDATTPVVQIHVTGVVQAPLEVSTNRVQFGTVKVGDTTTFKVMVRGNGAIPFTIQPLIDDGDGVSVQTLGTATPIQIVTVTFTPMKPGPIVKTVRLLTDLKAGTTVNLTVTAEAEPAATLLPPQ